jgi:phage terminase Nu1 subunit (DNA packaging protein)
VADAIADIQQQFPDIEPAIIDDLREELLKAGF